MGTLLLSMNGSTQADTGGLAESLARGGVSVVRQEALVATLAVCPGKPLVNSVTGEETSLEVGRPETR